MRMSKTVSSLCLIAFVSAAIISGCGQTRDNGTTAESLTSEAQVSDDSRPVNQSGTLTALSEQSEDTVSFDDTGKTDNIGKTNDTGKTDNNSKANDDGKPGNIGNSDDIVNNLLNNMTTEEKVGQMFFVRCPENDAVKKISEYHLGGYALFGRDFNGKSKNEIIKTLNSYQKAAEIPMLTGVDEEGGTVVRVSSNPNLRQTPFLSPKETFALGGWNAIESDAAEKADLLLSLGINVNMAPVCDITSDPNAFMYYRSFSDNVNDENRFVKTVVEKSEEKGLGTVLKHFPGYGNNEDTHTGIAYDDRKFSEFESTDFEPFKAGISAGADCIMVSHNIVNCMDKKYPASISENVHKIIREELNFDGVIMTDDLYMDAIRNYVEDSKAAVIAAKAGNDILCCTDFETQYPAVLKAVKNNEIPISQINESVTRILKWKMKLGLIK